MKLNYCYLLLPLVFTTCKQREESDLSATKSEQTIAWFTGAHIPLRTCVEVSPTVENAFAPHVDNSKIFFNAMVIQAYQKWMNYLRLKAIQPDVTLEDARKVKNLPPYKPSPRSLGIIQTITDAEAKIRDNIQACEYPNGKWYVTGKVIEASFPTALDLVDDCAEAQLTVHFGTKPRLKNPVIFNDPDSVLGKVIKDDQGGHIIIADHSEQLNYLTLTEPMTVLIHEIGHILGVPHVPGTVMDENYLSEFMDDAKTARHLTAYSRDRLFQHAGDIDQWRQLVLCEEASSLVLGSSLGLLQNFASPSLKKGLSSYLIYASGTSDYILKNESIIDPASKVEIVHSENLLEIFKRDAKFNLPPIYYKSAHLNFWVNNRHHVRMLFNSNAKDYSHTEIRRECPGRELILHETALKQHSSINFINDWVPERTFASQNVLQEFLDCFEGDNNLIPEKSLKITMGGKEHFTKQIQDFFAGDLQLVNPLPLNEIIQNSENTWCASWGKDRSDRSICIWRKNNLGLLILIDGAQAVSFPMVKFLPKNLPSSSPFKEHWQIAMQFKSKTYSDPVFNGYTTRLGLSEDTTTNPESIEFDYQVHVALGYFDSLAKGTLYPLQIQRPAK